MIFRRKQKLDTSIAAWIVAFNKERSSASPWQREFDVPDRIRIDRDGNITMPQDDDDEPDNAPS